MEGFDGLMRLAVIVATCPILYRMWDLDWWHPILALFALGAVLTYANIIPIGFSLWLLFGACSDAGGVGNLETMEWMISLSPLLLLPFMSGLVHFVEAHIWNVVFHRIVWIAVSGYLVWIGWVEEWYVALAAAFLLWNVLYLFIWLNSLRDSKRQLGNYEA